ncbi:MAG: diguanylate cyclase/phosphodiesterase (GGDEF & EAL domains) with PAS/PAC sensor(s) [uncultured Rubrobacteraceae bacterium]|uniref:Diguanylate cyclase/phosphodiesterase (GGDEF & EAL domains) with PAS/PAC sensor(S) n=1 Tax=uncultured Rubrobacteraceae bacterium TaxID=349277 RepID=A0A6J4R4P9_9ACTN|nr:MAG: diguanylate cyclase/phosphodiesterase (GGDEF & EAL domains) with PAS/PAC sensor(s) [uncultured Rubrobacteraceae bacterium]
MDIEEPQKTHLLVLEGPDLGTLHELDGEAVLGSDPSRADLILRDERVESGHARIYARFGRYFAEPLTARGHTELNGEVLTRPRPLSDRDRLRLGESVVEFAAQDPLKSRLIDNLRQTLNHDYLTGLLIKPRFDEELEQALAAAKERGEPLSVIMADVDNLKEINDEHGHLMGELAVGEIGRIIGRFHESDGRRATRFGGDEYQTVLPGTDAPTAASVAERLRRTVEENTFERDGVVAEPTLSLGVSTYPEHGSTAADLTRAADEALYRAKRSGGNTVVSG